MVASRAGRYAAIDATATSSSDTIPRTNGSVAGLSSDVRVAAYSLDHGGTWKLSERGPLGFRSGVDVSYGGVWIAVGPTREDISSDGGKHWTPAGPLKPRVQKRA